MNKNRIIPFIFSLFILISSLVFGNEREKYNFNSDWLLQVGDIAGLEKPDLKDYLWKKVSLPRALHIR